MKKNTHRKMLDGNKKKENIELRTNANHVRENSLYYKTENTHCNGNVNRP